MGEGQPGGAQAVTTGPAGPVRSGTVANIGISFVFRLDADLAQRGHPEMGTETDQRLDAMPGAVSVAVGGRPATGTAMMGSRPRVP